MGKSAELIMYALVAGQYSIFIVLATMAFFSGTATADVMLLKD